MPDPLSPHSDHVWGIDVGTRCVAFASEHGETRTVAFGSEDGARRLHLARAVLFDYATQLADRWPPIWVFVEQPMGHSKPSLGHMVGVALEAVYGALEGVSVTTILPHEWKKATVGKGNARKIEVRAWCEGQGVAPLTQDECDAYCVARAGRSRIK